MASPRNKLSVFPLHPFIWRTSVTMANTYLIRISTPATTPSTPENVPVGIPNEAGLAKRVPLFSPTEANQAARGDSEGTPALELTKERVFLGRS